MPPDIPHDLAPLLRHPGLEAARRHLEETDDRTLREQAELTRIPAPPFGEEARGRRVAELLRQVGLKGVETDEVGNVLGRLPGGRGGGSGRSGAPLVLAAHLDTVFPTETEVEVEEAGDVLRGPGISDNGRGLAALVALARTLGEVGLRPERPLLFAATVGEEGEGDLRGMRHLFREGGPGRKAGGVVALDGAGLTRVVLKGVGSRRFRVVVRGPGGHSWTDWGTPNPIHALGTAVAELTRMGLPSDPPATLTVARWGGGRSVNAIPEEAWVEVDLRSESPGILASTEEEVRRVLQGAVSAANAGRNRGTTRLESRVEVIGDRPAGSTDAGHVLVRAAAAATRALDEEPELVSSSTDANVPMSLGIPAITLGAGGEAGQAHTLQEWYRNVRGPDGIFRALLTVLAVAGVAGESASEAEAAD